MRWALRNEGLRRAGALGLALLAATLVACGDSDHDAGAYTRVPRDWTSGGQTGSLIPACGLSAETIEHGVPSAAPGVVLRTDAMGCDASAFEDLTVRDASGQAVAYSLIRLPDGSLLISLHGGLTPGRYRVELTPDPLADAGGAADDDAGVEPDAALPEPPPDAGDPATLDETFEVPERPRPQRFGTIERDGDACNADLTFVPDAAVLPFLSVLSIELQVDDGAVEPLVRPGALPVDDDGVARVRLPTSRLDAAGEGFHELRIVTRIAGESVPLETFLLSVEVPCGYEGTGDAPYDEEEEATCAVGMVGTSDASYGALLAGLALFALRRRRRKRR